MTQPFELSTKFNLYGADPWATISLDGLLEIQREHGALWAHAEDSGSESCYCEVARWNDARKRYERFAFCNCHDYRFPELPGARDEATADQGAKLINSLSNLAPRSPIVHSLPNWTGTKPDREPAQNSSAAPGVQPDGKENNP